MRVDELMKKIAVYPDHFEVSVTDDGEFDVIDPDPKPITLTKVFRLTCRVEPDDAYVFRDLILPGGTGLDFGVSVIEDRLMLNFGSKPLFLEHGKKFVMEIG